MFLPGFYYGFSKQMIEDNIEKELSIRVEYVMIPDAGNGMISYFEFENKEELLLFKMRFL